MSAHDVVLSDKTVTINELQDFDYVGRGSRLPP